MYGYAPKSEGKVDSSTPPPVIIPFDYMEGFMKDTLMAYGVPEHEAAISADVLIGKCTRIYEHMFTKSTAHSFLCFLVSNPSEYLADLTCEIENRE